MSISCGCDGGDSETLLEPHPEAARFCPYCGYEYLRAWSHDEAGQEIIIYRCLGCERTVQDFVKPKETTE